MKFRSTVSLLNFLGLAAGMFVALTPPATAAQKNLKAVTTTITAWKKRGGVGAKKYLSAFAWAGDCADARVQLWPNTNKTNDHKWRLTPVPLWRIKKDYPKFDDETPLYYIRSLEKIERNCEPSYLSVLLNCDDNPVVLHSRGNEKGAQWWSPVKLEDGVIAFENWYAKTICTGSEYLITDQNTFAKRFSEFKRSDLIGQWKTEIPIPPEKSAPTNVTAVMKGQWQRVAQCKGAQCEGIETTVEVGVSKSHGITNATTRGESLSLMVGTEVKADTGALPGGEVTAKMEITGTVSEERSRELSQSFTTEDSRSTVIKCTGKSSLWQWVSYLHISAPGTNEKVLKVPSIISRCTGPDVSPRVKNDISWNGSTE